MKIGWQATFFRILISIWVTGFFLTVCSCHVTYVFESESTLYSYVNVKELLPRRRREIWSLSDCNWTRTKWFWVRVQLQSLRVLSDKSSWNSSKEEPRFEVFLIRVEEQLFTVIERPVRHFILSQEEWNVIKALADDTNAVIKKRK